MGDRVIAFMAVVIAAGISLLLAACNLRPTISAQKLLQEASKQGAPLDEIFDQQATQGYYSDALSTARQIASGSPDYRHELSGMIIHVIAIRAENDDVQGAKGMITKFQPELGPGGIHAIRGIAFVQIAAGDLNGGLQTVAEIGAANDVLTWYGYRQIAKGDFDGALATSEKVSERSAYDLFYEVGDVLRQRSQQQRLRILASHMTDRKRAAEFVQAAKITLWERPFMIQPLETSPCDIAWHDATIGKFSDADHLIEAHNCGPMIADVLAKQYTTDPGGAESEITKIPNEKNDRIAALGALSEVAAKKGDIPDALRLTSHCEGLSVNANACLDSIRIIAWAWIQKGNTNTVLSWARSRPTAPQRGYALWGMAQALGHARPKIDFPQITADVEP